MYDTNSTTNHKAKYDKLQKKVKTIIGEHNYMNTYCKLHKFKTEIEH